jgi:hypothetical protein
MTTARLAHNATSSVGDDVVLLRNASGHMATSTVGGSTRTIVHCGIKIMLAAATLC